MKMNYINEQVQQAMRLLAEKGVETRPAIGLLLSMGAREYLATGKKEEKEVRTATTAQVRRRRTMRVTSKRIEEGTVRFNQSHRDKYLRMGGKTVREFKNAGYKYWTMSFLPNRVRVILRRERVSACGVVCYHRTGEHLYLVLCLRGDARHFRDSMKADGAFCDFPYSVIERDNNRVVLTITNNKKI